jgi:hypothetical protein
MAFQDTPNKATVRQKWNLPILALYVGELNRKLTYFGLPGIQIKDLIDWKDVLSYRTGVELLSKSSRKRDEQLRAINQIQLNVMLNGLDSNWQLLRGNVEDIILNGYDIDGIPPALNNGDVPHRRLFRYDLFNLDFIGGVGYADTKGESKRIRMIRKLFERQKGSDFLLLLTINVRDTVGGELSTYILEISDENPDDQELQATLEWYAHAGRGMKKYKLKSALPIAMQDFARFCSFTCYCYPPLAYYGYNALMVHYVFKLKFVPGRNFPIPRQQKIKELLDLPLVEIQNGNIVVAEVQHPRFDFSKCAQHLCFLSDKIQASALS